MAPRIIHYSPMGTLTLTLTQAKQAHLFPSCNGILVFMLVFTKRRAKALSLPRETPPPPDSMLLFGNALSRCSFCSSRFWATAVEAASASSYSAVSLYLSRANMRVCQNLSW